MRRTESSNRVDDLIERVTADLEESGLEGGLLTEERARSVDLDVSNRTEMTISTRSDDGGGLGESHHSESGSSRSSGHAEGGEGLSLRGELNGRLDGDDGGRAEEDGRSSATGIEEVVDVDFGVLMIEAFDGTVDEPELSFGDDFGERFRSSRSADEIDPLCLRLQSGEGNGVVGGSCSRQGDVVGESRGRDGRSRRGSDEESGDEEGSEHVRRSESGMKKREAKPCVL